MKRTVCNILKKLRIAECECNRFLFLDNIGVHGPEHMCGKNVKANETLFGVLEIMPELAYPFIGNAPDRKMTDIKLRRTLRLSLSSEEEAIHLYEAFAETTDSELAKAVCVFKRSIVHSLYGSIMRIKSSQKNMSLY